MASYKVAPGHRVTHDGVLYEGGQSLDGLSKVQADALLADGAVVSSATRAAASKPDAAKAEDKSEG